MKIKSIAAALSAAIILSANCNSMICGAAPEETTSASTSAAASTTTVTTDDQDTPETTVDWQQLHDDYQETIQKALEDQKKAENNKTPDDYYDDPYYDTDGNASLIDSKAYKVIYSSTELLFTAVTTKDGHVFYIIINYADEDGEDNVYFLNKVDDFDLYSLINNGGSNSDSSSSSSEKKDSTVEEYISQKTTTTSNDESPETTSSSATSSGKGSSKLRLFLLLALVVAIGAAGFIIPKFMNKKKSPKIEYDDELDEINEDDTAE